MPPTAAALPTAPLTPSGPVNTFALLFHTGVYFAWPVEPGFASVADYENNDGAIPIAVDAIPSSSVVECNVPITGPTIMADPGNATAVQYSLDFCSVVIATPAP
ncbi:MAG: hypothetical protein WB793_13740 [Candidatus Dormiibacterota bacterium]